MIRRFVVATLAGLLGGCIGDLPPEDFPCLMEQELYNKYNEAYVFSPQGEKKRQAMDIVREAETTCQEAQSQTEQSP